MPATITPGFYNLQFGIVYSGESNAPTPKPLYLTNNGEGKQLTVEQPTGQLNQEWSIRPPLNYSDSEYLIIIPALSESESKEVLAVSQDVVKSPGEVSLIKNLQLWSFGPVREADHLYVIRSNLYTGLVGSDPLLGVDESYQKAIIQFIQVTQVPPARPVWTLIGPLNEEKK